MDELIYEVQKELTDSNPHWKYTDYYKMVELCYWGCVPEWIKEYSNRNLVNSVYDIGVAIGTLLTYTKKLNPNAKLFATELLKHLSDDIIEKYDITFKESNIELQNIFNNRQFDIIIFTEIMEHLKFNPIPTMTKIKSKLTKDGRLYLTTPNVNVWGKLEKYKSYKDMPMPTKYELLEDLGHEYHYSLDEITEVLSAAGLEIIKVGYSPSNQDKRHINIEAKRMV